MINVRVAARATLHSIFELSRPHPAENSLLLSEGADFYGPVSEAALP